MDDAFFDDSSSALGLNHHAYGCGRIGAPRRLTKEHIDLCGLRAGEMAERHPHLIGIPTDLETGKPVFYADDLPAPDADTELYGKSPEETVRILERRESGENAPLGPWLLQREVKIDIHGGHGSSGRKTPKADAPNAVEQSRVAEAERSVQAYIEARERAT